MCVILVGSGKNIARHIPAATNTNPHGNGIAWLETVDGRKTIRYEKGLSDQTVLNLAREMGDQEIIFHARISTAGAISDELCHPFPVERVPSLNTSGSSDMVLFHNGHVNNWEQYAPQWLASVEPDKWSDSRAIAHALAMGFIDMKQLGSKIPGVYAIFSTQGFPAFPKSVGSIHRFGHWTLVKGGVWASNTNFLDYHWNFGKSRANARNERKRYARNFYRWEKLMREVDDNTWGDKLDKVTTLEELDKLLKESPVPVKEMDSWFDYKWTRERD